MRIDYPRSDRTGVRRFLPSWRQLLGLVGLGALAGVAAFVALYLLIDVPEPNEFATAESSVVYFDGGKAEIGRFAEVNRESVSLTEVPAHVQYAVLAAEDRSFYENQGISPRGIVRAAWNNFTGGSTQGASTITQQYARNAYLTQDRTWSRKLKESILAIKIDRELSKEQILEDYLNTIYFGRGAYGIQAASQAYFRRDARDLTVAQGAVLASVIRSPSAYDPSRDREAKERLEGRTLDYVIPGMVAAGWLEPERAARVSMPKVRKAAKSGTFGGPTGHLLQYVSEELNALGFTDEEIDTGGLRIVTTFDRQAQQSVVDAVTENFPTVDARGVEAGVASVEPGTGRLRAMYGGSDYLDRFVNNATAAQPVGSTFKAFTLAAAFDEGVTLSDTFAGNSPFAIPGTSDTVSNQGGASYGSAITLLTATQQSVNTAFVDLTVQISPQQVVDAAVAAGVPPDAGGMAAVPNVTLGPVDISPVTMAAAYATFAAEGTHVDPYSVASVRSASGALLYGAEPVQRDALPRDVSLQVTDALVQVVEGGTGFNAQALGRPVAGKTGNHEGKTALFVGYTPQLSTAVMFFRDLPGDRQASLNGVGGMPVFTGADYPTRIWTAAMSGALEGLPVEPFAPPPTPAPTSAPSPTKSPEPTPSETTEEPTESPSPTPTPTKSPSPTPTQTPSPPPSTTPPEEEEAQARARTAG